MKKIILQGLTLVLAVGMFTPTLYGDLLLVSAAEAQKDTRPVVKQAEDLNSATGEYARLKSIGADQNKIDKQEEIVKKKMNALETTIERVKTASLVTQFAIAAIATALFAIGVDVAYAKAVGKESVSYGYATQLLSSAYSIVPESVKNAASSAKAKIDQGIEYGRKALPFGAGMTQQESTRAKNHAKWAASREKLTENVRTTVNTRFPGGPGSEAIYNSPNLLTTDERSLLNQQN